MGTVTTQKESTRDLYIRVRILLQGQRKNHRKGIGMGILGVPMNHGGKTS